MFYFPKQKKKKKKEKREREKKDFYQNDFFT